MTNKIIEVLKKNVVSFNDHDVIFGGDGDLTDLANELEQAINYTHSCETLKDKKKITFDEWLGKWNWERIGSSYTFKRGESYTDAESLMISYKKEYSL